MMKTFPLRQVATMRPVVNQQVNQSSFSGLHRPFIVTLLLLLSASAFTFGQTLSASMPFPEFNSSYISGTPINIRINTTTPVSTTVTKVEFFVQENFSGTYAKIGEDETAPYSYTWTAPNVATSRNYQLRAVVTNSASATAISNAPTNYNNVTVYAPTYANSRNWYVSASAPATNTAGTEAAPFNTIQKAADRVAPGDTVFVMAGKYQTNSFSIVTIRRTGLPSKWIVFKPYKTDKPVVQLGNNNWQGIYLVSPSAYVRVEGFEVIGNNANVTLADALNQPTSCANPGGTPQPRFNGGGIQVDGRNGNNLNPHHVAIVGNSIHDCSGGGMGIIEADYATVDNNTVYNNAWYTIYAGSGISLFHLWNYDDHPTGYHNLVRNNKCYGNRLFVPWNVGCQITDGNGIIIDDLPNSQASSTIRGQRYTGRTLVANNVVFNNGGSGIHTFKGLHTDIVNNTAYQNSQSQGPNTPVGDIHAQQSEFVNIINNIIQPIAGERTFTSNNSNIGIRYTNNLYLVDNPATQVPPSTSSVTSRDNLILNPASATAVFTNPGTDPATADFTLKDGSQAINVGVNNYLAAIPVDASGISRPQGAGVDIGAFEFQGTPIAITQQPASSSAVCAGAEVSVSVSVDGAVKTYQWYKDGSVLTGVSSATTAALTLPTTTTADQGAYFVVITGFNSLTSTAFTLTVNSIPVAELTSSGIITCSNPTVTLTASPSSDVTYAFSSGATQVGSSNTATVSQAGTYSVVVTSSQGCSASASTSVEFVNDLATPTLQTQDGQSSLTVSQYSGDIVLVASGCAGTVNWSGPENTSGVSSTIAVSTLQTGTLVYSATCQLGSCISPVVTATITVVAASLALGVPQYACATNQLTLATSGGNGQPVEYHIAGVTNGWSSQSSYVLDAKLIRKDKPLRIDVRQRQADDSGWNKADRDFTLPNCGAAGRKLAEQLPEIPLQVTVLGNPIKDQQVRAQVRGAAGQPLLVELINQQGRSIDQQRLERSEPVQEVVLNTGATPGMYLLRVSTSGQRQTVKLLKP